MIADAKATITKDEINGKKKAIGHDFTTPKGTGYQPQKKTKNRIGKDSMEMMISTGIKEPDLLRDINAKIGEWEDTNVMVMDD